MLGREPAEGTAHRFGESPSGGSQPNAWRYGAGIGAAGGNPDRTRHPQWRHD